MSHSTIEELLRQIDGLTTDPKQAFELWIPQNLTWRGQPARTDVAMAIIGDKILGMGYKPDGFTEAEGGRIYRYKAF